ncbi:hypothetical protein SAMN05421767_1032 [Granulicatella balaenopterae]|uniref:CAAX prenyl protease 2/Lysostaphin resistance protein A-like domain-containing protein n=1 Tax=Granulicatella balaenopterae TaxID=137733 RepID=A0A1H9HN03_9LACT|nr:type II CAAX endopeptidase family protein [Granulicatella balaenopterae]SEQ63729.1 hypothetical protein SAMN05421767_1032 [Granulicatella balaenopterae]
MENRSDFFNSTDNTTINETPIKRDLSAKKAVGRTSLFLISYQIIMTVASIVTMVIAIIKTGEYLDVASIQNAGALGAYTDALMLGLLVSTFFGVILFLYLEKGSDLIRVLQEKNRKISVKTLARLMTALMAVQVVFSVGSTAVEWLLNLFGISMLHSIEAASLGGYSLPIILYAGIIGPITEEVIFRGAILHYLERFGKWFAMILSSLLFGAFHANLPQAAFAFLMGLILAYVTYEYSIKWAMVLHIFNNLILNILITALGDFTNPDLIEKIQIGILVVAFVYTAIIIWRNKEQIKTYILELKQDNASFKEAFSSVALWFLLVILGIEGISMLTSI